MILNNFGRMRDSRVTRSLCNTWQMQMTWLITAVTRGKKNDKNDVLCSTIVSFAGQIG